MLMTKMQTPPIDIHKCHEINAVCDTQYEQGAGKLAANDVGGEKVQERGQNQVDKKYTLSSTHTTQTVLSDTTLHDDNKSFVARGKEVRRNLL